MPDPPDQKTSRSGWVTLGRLSGLALLLPCAVVVGYAAGWWLDHHFRTGHVFTIAGTLTGALAGLYELLREALKS